MQPLYSEKEVLEDALSAQKSTTNILNMYANECVHNDLKATMMQILEQEHTIQKDVFDIMHEKGFYPTPEAEPTKVESAKQKFSQSVKMQ
ncbi:MAG: spore coat protein [Clostridia bacterium]|nr:spore coat protein [Clostridia bacterium]NCC43042.1 spore coat protein [Clostridia bacterium]